MTPRPDAVPQERPSPTPQRRAVTLTRTPDVRTRLAAPSDLPQIASLFQAVFRNGQLLHRPDLIAAMQALYMDGPWFDPECASIVHTAKDGTIDGFMGMQPMTMLWRGAPIRARISSCFMVADPARNPMAAHRMLSTLRSGPQDIAVSDTSNLTSVNISERMQFQLVPESNLQWCCVLRPAGFGREMLRPRLPAVLAALGEWPARLIDGRAKNFRQAADASLVDTAVTHAAFATAADQLAEGFAVRPDWRGGGLEWQLSLVASKRQLGALQIREVRDGAARLLGAYLYYCPPGGIATVVQILAAPGAASRVIASLCGHAYGQGCVAVRGQTQPALMGGLIRTKNVFYRHVDSTLVYARDPELLAALTGGQAMLGGLVGDTWTRLSSDSFA